MATFRKILGLNNDFKRCQDFKDTGKIRCLYQNRSRYKDEIMKPVVIFPRVVQPLVAQLYGHNRTKWTFVPSSKKL